MVLSFSYNELLSLIAQKTGVKLDLRYKTPDTVSVAADVPIKVPILGNVVRRVAADVRIVGLDGTILALELNAGAMLNMLLEVLKDKIQKVAPAGLIKKIEGQKVVLQLAALPEAKSVLDVVDVSQLKFTKEQIYVEGALR